MSEDSEFVSPYFVKSSPYVYIPPSPFVHLSLPQALSVILLGLLLVSLAAVIWETSEQLCPLPGWAWLRFLRLHSLWHLSIGYGVYLLLQVSTTVRFPPSRPFFFPPGLCLCCRGKPVTPLTQFPPPPSLPSFRPPPSSPLPASTGNALRSTTGTRAFDGSIPSSLV